MPDEREEDKYALYEKRIRNGVLFCVAAAGAFHVIFFQENPSPTVVALICAILGLVPVLGQAESRARKRDNDDSA